MGVNIAMRGAEAALRHEQTPYKPIKAEIKWRALTVFNSPRETIKDERTAMRKSRDALAARSRNIRSASLSA